MVLHVPVTFIDVSPDSNSHFFVSAESIILLGLHRGCLEVGVRGLENSPRIFPFPSDWSDTKQQAFICDLAAQVANASRR